MYEKEIKLNNFLKNYSYIGQRMVSTDQQEGDRTYNHVLDNVWIVIFVKYFRVIHLGYSFLTVMSLSLRWVGEQRGDI